MASTLLIVGGLAVAGGLAYVVYQQATAPAADPCGTPINKAAGLVAKYYGQTLKPEDCAKTNQATDLIGKLLEGWGSKDAKNKELNGPVDVELTEQIRGFTGIAKLNAAAVTATSAVTTGGMGGTGGGTISPKDLYLVLPLLNGSVLRFKNGGVPFAGHPDFVKCAAGTHDMTTSLANEVTRFWCKTPGKRPTSTQFYASREKDGAAALAALIDTRFPPRFSDMFRGSNNDPTTHVPSSIVAGVKHVCASGVLIEVIPVTDNRDGASAPLEGGRTIIKRCGAPGTAPTTAPPVASSGSSTTYTAPPGSPPPGFHWVQAAVVGGVNVPAHWERDR